MNSSLTRSGPSSRRRKRIATRRTGGMPVVANSSASTSVNTSFIERHNGTDRNRNSRKVRKTYCFSKDWDMHEAATYFVMYSYNFCWPVRTLRTQSPDGRRHDCTPAMAAGLADHPWPLWEWITMPAVQR